jgi:hypothetical protein
MALEKQKHNVSVIIPAYKAAATIGVAVRSCLDDAAVAEIIVVVDGPDAALQGAIPHSDRVRSIVNLSTMGAPAARNAGLRAARGEFILFLDADDYVEGGLIGALAQAGEAEGADIVFGSYAFELASGRRIPVNVDETIGTPTAIGVLKSWFAGNYVPCCSVLWRAAFIRRIGGWNEAFLKNQDGELVWRACRQCPSMACVTTGRGIYVQGTSGGRVGGNLSAAALGQQIEFLSEVERRLSGDELRQLSGEIGATYYRLARLAYYNDLVDIGIAAERAARRLGYGGHGGSVLHRAFAAIFGLRLKEQLCVKLHRVERTFGLLRPRVRLLSGIEQ